MECIPRAVRGASQLGMCAIFSLVAACAGAATKAVATSAAIPIAESTFFKVFPFGWELQNHFNFVMRA